MIPKNREPTAPGALLKRILEESNITQEKLKAMTGIGIQTINMIINGKRNITSETALLLGKAFDMTPEFWLQMQMNLDLYRSRRTLQEEGRI
jgi:addiction module HigA family antidote